MSLSKFAHALSMPCLAFLAALFGPLVTISTPTLAHEYKLGTLEIMHPWTRATPKGAKVAGGYLTLTNRGAAADRLVAVEASAAAGKIELHEMTVDHGVMKMRQLAHGIGLPAGQTVTLEPGGLHVMFLDLKAPLKEGESVSARLIFEKAGSIDVTFKVEAMGARGGDMHKHKGH
jgi:periplasmic copper chaperone A